MLDVYLTHFVIEFFDEIRWKCSNNYRDHRHQVLPKKCIRLFLEIDNL